MLNSKKAVIGVVLALQMAFSSVAGAMTVKEYKALPDESRNKVFAQLVLNQIETRKQSNPAQAQCLDDQFFKVSTNALGVPDGSLFVKLQIEKSYEKDPNGRHVEDVVKFAMNHIANKACSSTEQAKVPENKDGKKEVASLSSSSPVQFAKKLD